MSLSARRGTIAFAILLTGVAALGRACTSSHGAARAATDAGGEPAGGDSGSDRAAEGGGGAGGTSGAGDTTSVGGASGVDGHADAQPCPTQTPPSGIPDGWEPYTAYSCACRLFVPGAGGALPSPVTWEPCPQPGPTNPTCRRMNTSWTTGTALSILPRFWFDKTQGKAYLEFDRTNFGDDQNVRYRLVADVEGPIRNAFLQLNPANQGCEVLDKGLNDGKYSFGVLGDAWSGPIADVEGVIAGDIGAASPSVVLKQSADKNLHTDWSVGADWLSASQASIRARSWNASVWQTVYDPAQDPDHMPEHGARPSGAAVFWEVGAGGYRGVMSWTAAAGARPVLRWYGDFSQGAGNFNTDGIDMVWTYGTGTLDSTLQFPTRSIMTTSYTTDPTQAQGTARRLRSDPGPLSPYPFGVGCGYAARQVTTLAASDASAGSNDLLIVRLSDGVSWLVSAPPIEQKMGFDHVLGLTCDEVFATATFADEPTTIVRIRLDSLGPGMPPD